ncbi:MAG: Phosphoribosylformylglycinamidine cyclo-ligase [Planctomycetes bacterium ADurb.Bin401]|nr:MAG: Phosphoribosylformylglycinamidine cyclo-ligase [Planctomycetes bacterium ADurb.Bin401]
MTDYLTYAKSGVDIDANDVMVERIRSSVQSTYGPRVIDIHGGFAGLFRLDYDEKLFKKNYKNPVLAACTDGVGTKMLVARDMKKFDTVGFDLVAMNVNDMLVMGAEPLFFLDYLAVNKLEPAKVAEIVESVSAACRLANCALIGGETAEMPDIYKKEDFDMAGFAVGVVEKNKIINGSNVKNGDIILGLASSGLHSNGYALARHICFKKLGLKVNQKMDEFGGKSIGEALLAPTKIYVRPIIKLLSQYKTKHVIHGMAHITGGGLPGNVPRVLPPKCDAVLDKSSWKKEPIFDFLQENGPVEEEEMFRVFNMGIGYVLIVAPDFAASVAKKLRSFGETVYKIGAIRRGTGNVIIK